MPKVFILNGYRFHFFSNEGDPLEPCHIHIQKGSNRSKYWIDPLINLEYNYGYSAKELNEIHKIIEENVDIIRSKWNEHFNH